MCRKETRASTPVEWPDVRGAGRRDGAASTSCYYSSLLPNAPLSSRFRLSALAILVMSQSLSECALCRCLEYSLTRLAEMICVGEKDVGAATMLLRRRLFSIVHSLPITSKELYREACQNAAFEYMLFYERIRLGISSPHFFLDGVPSGVHLFVGATSVHLANSEVGRLKLRDVIADRLQVVGRMEAMCPESDRKIQLTTRHTANLGPEVPGPVRFLVDRSRAIFSGLRATKREDLFAQCSNCNCSRLFYKGEVLETWSTAVITCVSTGDDEEDVDSKHYWGAVAGTALDVIPSTRRFCSRACAAQHAHHLKIMMPDCGLHLDADDPAIKTGRARVAESFRLALKRNEVAARALRTMRSKHMRNLAVSVEELELHRQQRITALNIDLGLLYASSIIAESSGMCRGRILPGQQLYWRDDPALYAKPLGSVVKIYHTMKRKEGIVSSLLTTPRYMENIRAKAYKMF